MKKLMLSLLILLMATACRQSAPKPLPENVAELSPSPEIFPADKKYEGVFQMLDGVWEGVFYVYEDSLGQRPGKSRPKIENLEFADFPLKLVKEIYVRQTYHSETPYFQRVIIIDRVVVAEGDTQTVVSEGVNKVMDGQLWCIVKKPDETIIHRGQLKDANTIIWERDEKNPRRIEYFHESVEGDYYKIIGWGYYENDDPRLSPRVWYVGDYSRVDSDTTGMVF